GPLIKATVRMKEASL
ncbi:hypothetical protein A2U01_0091334, partial [Trifolium medium]|nr:hypothetical protein [Trifolium medium]